MSTISSIVHICNYIKYLITIWFYTSKYRNSVLLEILFESFFNPSCGRNVGVENQIWIQHLKNRNDVRQFFSRQRKRQNKFTKEAASEVPLPHNETRPATQEIFTATFRVSCVRVGNKVGEVENFRWHLNYVSITGRFVIYTASVFLFCFATTAIKKNSRQWHLFFFHFVSWLIARYIRPFLGSFPRVI